MEDVRQNLIPIAKEIANAILQDMSQDWELVAASKLKGHNLSPELVKYVIQQANRHIKLHFLNQSSPDMKKLPGKVMNPEHVLNLMNMNMQKQASEEKVIDLSVYRTSVSSLKKEAISTKITIDDLNKEFSSNTFDFNFVHNTLSKYASENYYKLGDIEESTKAALQKLAEEKMEVINKTYDLQQEIALLQKEAREMYDKLHMYGYKDEADKVASAFGIYSKFLNDAPVFVKTVVPPHLEHIVELRKGLEFKLKKIQHNEDMLNTLLRLAKDYNIVSDALKKYIDYLAVSGKKYELNSILKKLDIL